MDNLMKYRIGIDTGGTFVDAVEFDEESRKIRQAKSPTTPTNPSLGVMNAIAKLGTPLEQTYLILHGTTLGVNAIIQRKGVKTGIITNEGFQDIFEIGRGNVLPKEMYNHLYVKPSRIVRRKLIYGAPGRINSEGNVIFPLDEERVKSAATELVNKHGVDSIAVCYLNSYRNAEHERRTKSILLNNFRDLHVSISSDVINEYREYERMSTTVIDAYINPIVATYLDQLSDNLAAKGFKGSLLIMRSDGGVMSTATATNSPISTVQSGPAGGVVGAVFLSKYLGRRKMITTDVGGTSLDVCIIEESSSNVVHQSYIEDYPMLVTMYDIRSIGAGGGSIASVKNGILKVGPESAGADPGPMCYGKGGAKPTMTDASVVLGYINPKRFLSGDVPLNAESSVKGVREQIADPLGVTIDDAAIGIIRLTITNSMGAVRQITIEEGRDPSEYCLLCFGGAGPLIGSVLAKELGVPEVIVPYAPAAFSAWGMLTSDLSYEVSKTHFEFLDELDRSALMNEFAELETKVSSVLSNQGVAYDNILIQRKLELRYFGQEHALEISIEPTHSTEQIAKSFNQYHFRRYGHQMNERVEIVNFRVKGVGFLKKPNPNLTSGTSDFISTPSWKEYAYCLVTNKRREFAVYLRDKLQAGVQISGPAIIDEGVTRTLIHTGQNLTVDAMGNLVIKT